MKQLQELIDKGWKFVIWLSKPGGVIVQGARAKNDDDWEFDVQSPDFAVAIRAAVSEARRLDGVMK